MPPELGADALIAGKSVTGTSAAPLWRRLGVAALEAMTVAILVALVVLLFAGVILRYFFNTPLISVDELSSTLFLWLVMLGAVLATDRHAHLRLTLVVDSMPENLGRFVNTLGLVIVVAFLAAIFPASVRFFDMESMLKMPSLGISVGYRVVAIPIGIALMSLFAVGRILKYGRWRDIFLSIVLVAGIAAICFLLRPLFDALGRADIFIFLIGFLLVCLFMGVPIAFCFGVAVLTFLAFTTNLPLTVIVGRMNEGMSGLILLSVPIFVLLGCILDETGMGKAIVDLLGSIVGHVRAGMSYVLLGSLYLVSGISGSKVSDMATVAPALFPEMRRRGNRPPEMVALLATGAIMADTVPPSIMLIVLGSVAGVSIAALFASGFVVAFWLLAALAIAARWNARHEILESVKRAPFAMIWKALLIATPALVLPFMIRGAVVNGVATATEVSTVAVIYAMIAGIFLYGGISLRTTYKILVETSVITGGILLIMGTAAAGAWALTQTGFGNLLAAFVTDLPGGWVSYMFVTIALFVFLGCILEGLPAIVLLGPLLFPIARSMGIDEVHYAMVVVVSVNIGMFIPPVGIGFYIACSIGRVSPKEAIRSIYFYLAALLAMLALIALFPAMSTWML